MKPDKRSMRLYAVTDRAWLKDGERLADKVEEAIKGGVTFVQLREKQLDYAAFKAVALEVKEVCVSYGVPFVINDNVELARDIDADGVHVGQGDMEIKKARAILGSDKIIGVSAANLYAALAAEKQGADYIGVGSVFHTDTKSDAKPVAREEIRRITGAVTIPAVAIGGIGPGNIKELAELELSGAAVVSAIFAQEDVYLAAERLRALCDEVFGA